MGAALRGGLQQEPSVSVLVGNDFQIIDVCPADSAQGNARGCIYVIKVSFSD